MEENYQQILEDLRTGKIKEYEVDMDHFMDFQKVLMNYQYKKSVIGEAKRGGGAVYHFDDGSNSNN
ncbi:MAG TPA: hypothetical protein H9861_02410 [Candidatus Ligilactobacillus excrementigallinarum]|uniref:Uncharacterized protein n=1 Tax=Candidatus Ligilactobacillus excrementigallinarum TaxID=2838641 RepID=A0A9D2AAC5_9LACO|nr:hypothetical protein [Candidatus Ligilactobacillus excrementigallinarum]